MDVGHHTAAGDGGAAEQLGQLLVIAHGELDVARHDTGLLVVPGGVSGQLQDLDQRGRTTRLEQAATNAMNTKESTSILHPRNLILTNLYAKITSVSTHCY